MWEELSKANDKNYRFKIPNLMHFKYALILIVESIKVYLNDLILLCESVKNIHNDIFSLAIKNAKIFFFNFLNERSHINFDFVKCLITCYGSHCNQCRYKTTGTHSSGKNNVFAEIVLQQAMYRL